MSGLSYGEGQVATAGDIQGYIVKLSKLGKTTLEARIAKLKLKLKVYARILKSGKFAKAGKPGPKNARQANFALRGCQNALSWHEQALKASGVATAKTAK